MGNLSEIRAESGIEVGPDGRAAVVIAVAPHWGDHRFQGRAVLPAVEAMQLLAHWARRFRPETYVRQIRKAAFDKFLELPPAGGRIEAWCEFQEQPDGGLRATLLTRTQAKSARMTRTKIHAQVDFHPAAAVPPLAALDLAAALEGCCTRIDPQTLYQELVPFGPGFQTIAQPVLLTAEGALAMITAPELADGQTEQPLGSPFVLDAAFHAACVWGQRHTGVVAFPVGIAQRIVGTPTRPGETYVSRIFPVQIDPALLSFDIWIVDMAGRPCEIVRGVSMRDVSGGRLRAPEWIRAHNGESSIAPIAAHCASAVLIERCTLMPFADQCLSARERLRTDRMGTKRRIDFLSSRLACKRLYRRLSGNADPIPASEIETLTADGSRPAVGGARCHCSVAHDRRFTVAVAGTGPIGVDVEPLDGRVLKSLGIFMDAGEQERVSASALGAIGAALRVWTIKEAVAKMLNIHLADSWARTRVVAIGSEQSQIRIGDGPEAEAVHQQLEDHLVTLVCQPDFF
jgi:phosphopantetheinyl transferase